MHVCVWESVTHKTLAMTIATIIKMTTEGPYVCKHACVRVCVCVSHERFGLRTCAYHFQLTNNQLTVRSCAGKFVIVVAALNLFVYATFTRAVVVYCSFPISDFLFHRLYFLYPITAFVLISNFIYVYCFTAGKLLCFWHDNNNLL